MTTHLFVDESLRGPYLLVAGVVHTSDIARTRTLLRGLRLPGERSIHFQAERDTRRRFIVSRLVEWELTCRVYIGKGQAETVRQACLSALLADAQPTQVQRIVLESRGDALDRIDRRTIAGELRGTGGTDCQPTYVHLRPHEEPGLWLPDAVAWSYGAGGNWRTRVQPLVDMVVDLGPVQG